MENPIDGAGVKINRNGTFEIVSKGTLPEVNDTLAKLLHQDKDSQFLWIASEPMFVYNTLANKYLTELTNTSELPEAGKVIQFEDESSLRVDSAQDLNPLRNDPSVIPTGDYCYSGTRERLPDEPTHTAEGLPIRYLKFCPYMSHRTFNGVDITWCNFLDKGSIDGSSRDSKDPERSAALYEEEERKLIEHFGSEEALEEAAPLFLLWDSCKECGINDSDEEG